MKCPICGSECEKGKEEFDDMVMEYYKCPKCKIIVSGVLRYA